MAIKMGTIDVTTGMPGELKYWEGIPPDGALVAPAGKFRLVTVDTFSDEGGVEADFDTLEQAAEKADKLGKNAKMFVAYVYDDKGKLVHRAGKR